MAESPPSAVPALRGLAVEAVEWLPSGAESGLVRVRGRWTEAGARESGLPALALRAAGRDHRFESLPDARFSRDPDTWRGTYLVPAELVVTDPEALWLEWASGVRAGLPPLSRGLEPPPVPTAPAEPEPGGDVIDRAVLAERRARRAEAAEQAQARRAAEALKAVEVLELRSAELERRLEEATAERDALASRPPEPAGRDALAAALASAADLRSRARDWQLRLRTGEVARASDAVRLAVIEAEHATGTSAIRAALKQRTAELEAARRESEALSAELSAAAEAAAAARADAESRIGAARAEAAQARAEAESRIDAARAEADSRIEAARAEAAEARAEAESRIEGARAEAAEARAETESRLAEARTAWDRRREELEAAVEEVRSELDAARREAAAQVGRARDDAAAAATELIRAREEADGRIAVLRRETEGERAARAELERELAEARVRAGELEEAHSATLTRLQTAETTLAAAEGRLRVETVARATLEDELDRARAALTVAEQQASAAREEAAGLRRTLEEARAEAEGVRDEALRAGASFQERIAELESRAADRDRLERLAREQSEAAAAREPAPERAAMAADLDAAAEALRTRTPGPPPESPEPAAEPIPPTGADDESPPAGTAQGSPSVGADEGSPLVGADEGSLSAGADEGSHSAGADEGSPLVGADEGSPPVGTDEGSPPAGADESPSGAVEEGSLSTGFEEAAAPAGTGEGAAPAGTEVGAAPAGTEVGAAPAGTGEGAAPAGTEEGAAPAGTEEGAAPAGGEQVAAPGGGEGVAAPAGVAEDSPPVAASSPAVAEPPKAAGPKIVSPARPPSRAHVVGRSRRDYPLLRGAVVKLAHDDPETAGRLLVALLPAQALVITGPLAYDLTVGELGTFGVTIAGKRTFVERLERPRSRGQAEFHLKGDALVLAELLAGVDHRIGRWFGPVRARGRHRKLKALRALPESRASLAELARVGARLDPEPVYRALAYAVHPSWTRGHRFTVAQAVIGDPPETWYLTARDGAGLSASAAPPDGVPDATVSMSRTAFDRMLRGEPAAPGDRPVVRGDREAVALMHAWTLRAQGAG